MADEVIERYVANEKRLPVPLDQEAIRELTGLFSTLSGAQQEFLLARFPNGGTDAEALEIASRRRDSPITAHQLGAWQSHNSDFVRAYDILSTRLVDWQKHLAMSLEAGNAVKAAMENRRLLDMPWEDLDSRKSTAKAQAAQGALERVVGKHERVDVTVVRIEDLL